MDPKGQFVTGWFTPLSGSIPPPPEGGWEPPWGKPTLPIPPLPPGVDPPDPPLEPEPGEPTHPIVIPAPPTLPPGWVWPPFDPSDGLHGKVVLLCWIPGVAKPRWVVVDLPELPGLPPGFTPPAGGIGGAPPPRPGPGR